MAQTDLASRRLMPEDEVYRQVFDAEVRFDYVLASIHNKHIETARLTVCCGALISKIESWDYHLSRKYTNYLFTLLSRS